MISFKNIQKHCATLINSASKKHGMDRHFFKLKEISKSYPITNEVSKHQKYCFTKKTYNLLRKEIKAVSALVNRSKYITSVSNIHTSVRTYCPPLALRSTEDPEKNQDTDDEEDSDSDDEDPKFTLFKTMFLYTLFVYLAVVGSYYATVYLIVTTECDLISWNEFCNKFLAKGKVEQIVIRPELGFASIYLRKEVTSEGRVFRRLYHLTITSTKEFEKKFKAAETQFGNKDEVQVEYDRISRPPLFFIPFVIFIILCLMMTFRTTTYQKFRKPKFTLVKPDSKDGKGVKFEDVAGLQNAKAEIMECVDYLQRPEYYKNLGAKLPKGVLLLGPPGCGKTLLAKAVATESNVPFFSMNGTEFMEVFGGLGASRVRGLFHAAKLQAPSIMYIDELDAIGQQRSLDDANSEMEHTLVQLLVEMDGMRSCDDIIVIASTNRTDLLDEALLRPGRFSRHILIDLPTLEERQEIFECYLKKLALQDSPSAYSKKLAFLTRGFSGADIANVCNEAAIHAGRHQQNKITGDDLEYAIGKRTTGIYKHNSSMTPKEREIVAYHECGHALVGWMLEHTEILLKVSIIPNFSSALGRVHLAEKDRRIESKEQLFDRMCLILGGKAAEVVMFNSSTTAGQEDLEMVNKLAYDQIRIYGMNEKIGLISFPEKEDSFEMSPFSRTLKRLMELETSKLVAEAYLRTEKVIRENKPKLDLLAKTLLVRETLTYKEIEQLIGPPPFTNKKLLGSEEFEFLLKSIAAKIDEEGFCAYGKYEEEYDNYY